MQNNPRIGPIYAVAKWSTKRCARLSHGVGSNPISGIFGNIFIDLLFYFINKYKYYLTTNTHMSEVEVYSVNKLTF